MFCEHSVNSLDCSVAHKFLKIIMYNETSHIRVKYYVISTTQISILILIMSSFTHSIWQLPCVSRFTIWCLHVLFFWLVNIFMHTNIDESLLIKILFICITNQFLGSCLHAIKSNWLYEFSTHR